MLCIILIALALFGLEAFGADVELTDEQPLALPPVGAHQLRIITPKVLELSLITTKKPAPAPVEQWDFIAQGGATRVPRPDDFQVTAGAKRLAVNKVGFKRRVLYAPFKQRDLRIGNYLYLQLAGELDDNQTVEVKNPGQKLWLSNVQFQARNVSLRWNPAIHVNQTGYLPSYQKTAMAGYYLGSVGELDFTDCHALSTNGFFQLLKASSSEAVFRGQLKPRIDRGFPVSCYQQVLEADFSEFKTPGEYRLFIPGLGASFPFFIGDDVAGAIRSGGQSLCAGVQSTSPLCPPIGDFSVLRRTRLVLR